MTFHVRDSFATNFTNCQAAAFVKKCRKVFRFFLFQFHFESCKKKRNTNVTFSDYLYLTKIFRNLRASTYTKRKRLKNNVILFNLLQFVNTNIKITAQTLNCNSDMKTIFNFILVKPTLPACYIGISNSLTRGATLAFAWWNGGKLQTSVSMALLRANI